MSHLSLQERIEKSKQVLKSDLNTVRAGRANASLLDKVLVDYYGTPSPFDPSSLPEIEKAINKSELGITPSNDGKCIRLVVPQLTEERRKELAKIIKKMGEDCKIAVRNMRRDENDHLKKQQKGGELSEDELAKELDNVQKTIEAAIKEIDQIIAEKDKELMEV